MEQIREGMWSHTLQGDWSLVHDTQEPDTGVFLMQGAFDVMQFCRNKVHIVSPDIGPDGVPMEVIEAAIEAERKRIAGYKFSELFLPKCRLCGCVAKYFRLKKSTVEDAAFRLSVGVEELERTMRGLCLPCVERTIVGHLHPSVVILVD